MTFYLYLNDVEAGGGTEFDKLGLEVKPKVGRAVLWPSVLNEAPSRKDDRTMHAALPVEAGIKYGANAWFHLRSKYFTYDAMLCYGMLWYAVWYRYSTTRLALIDDNSHTIILLLFIVVSSDFKEPYATGCI